MNMTLLQITQNRWTGALRKMTRVMASKHQQYCLYAQN